MKATQISSFFWPRLSVGAMFLMVLLGSGCAHHRLNQPLTHYYPEIHDRDHVAPVPTRSSDLNFFVALSGGGTRAAAMAYGTLEALEKVQLPASSTNVEPHTLLDEVDYITSVSGGSFVGAYYALFGKRIFTDFERKFLYRPVGRILLHRLFNPINWVRMTAPCFNRSDLAAEYYDRILFEGKTFGDVIPPERGPVFHPQATDVLEGSWFSFSDYQFAMICSDLKSYPVSMAVTASSAFPGPFAAITLKNYAGQCGFELEPWMKEALNDRENPTRGFHVALRTKEYQDLEQKKFIHLMDGGISDNLGIQAPLEHSIYGRRHVLDGEKVQPRRSVMIIVNAKSKKGSKWNLLAKAPGFFAALGVTSATMINNQNFATVEFMRASYETIQHRMDAEGKPYDHYLIEISLDQLPDEKRREYLMQLPTALSLKRKDVDALSQAAAEILYSSKKFQALVKGLGGTIPEQ